MYSFVRIHDNWRNTIRGKGKNRLLQPAWVLLAHSDHNYSMGPKDFGKFYLRLAGNNRGDTNPGTTPTHFQPYHKGLSYLAHIFLRGRGDYNHPNWYYYPGSVPAKYSP